MDAIKSKLTELAEMKGWEDRSKADGDEYFCVDDYAGGNVDDAYQGGFQQGQIDLAQELLALLKLKD